MSVATTTAAASASSFVYKPTSSLDEKSVATSDSDKAQDRFLKLLVAQLNNQDPMNPLDNAQMTSQIAQINTVTGITKLNDTVGKLATQFNSGQMMQGASLVGRDVMVEGNAMTITDGKASGVFELAEGATGVAVQISTPGGVVLDTVKLGAQDAGSHGFTWDASAYPNTNLQFKVTATNGSNPVTSTTYMRDKVLYVGMESGALSLELQSSGSVAYDKVKGVL